jgi:hypothetical protein
MRRAIRGPEWRDCGLSSPRSRAMTPRAITARGGSARIVSSSACRTPLRSTCAATERGNSDDSRRKPVPGTEIGEKHFKRLAVGNIALQTLTSGIMIAALMRRSEWSAPNTYAHSSLDRAAVAKRPTLPMWKCCVASSIGRLAHGETPSPRRAVSLPLHRTVSAGSRGHL